MAATIIGTGDALTCSHARMLAKNLPDEYEIHQYDGGFIVYNEGPLGFIGYPIFNRLANFAKNHWLEAHVEVLGGKPAVYFTERLMNR